MGVIMVWLWIWGLVRWVDSMVVQGLWIMVVSVSFGLAIDYGGVCKFWFGRGFGLCYNQVSGMGPTKS